MPSTRTGLLLTVACSVILICTNAYAQVRCDRFEIKAELVGHRLTVSLETDLPEETTVMVSVDRRYWQEGTDDAYSESYLSGRFTVGEWRESRAVDVEDDIWTQALQRQQELMARIGDPFEVERIADEIEVDFTVPVNQKDPRFGRRNEKLTGSKVTTSSTGLRIVEAVERFNLPLGIAADDANAKTPIHPHKLEKGNRYQLTGPVPLMPKREATDRSDLEQVRELREGDLIEILQKDESGYSPWYRVNAIGEAGKRLGSGWINSTALLRHEVWEAGDAEDEPRDSYKQLGEVEDVSFARVKRLSIRIEVPLSRSREEVEETLKKAALDLYEKERRMPKAISVFAYMPGDDSASVYTVGKAEYAPNGKWEDAAKRGPMRFSIDLGTVYFDVSKLTERYSEGTKVALRSQNGQAIKVSRSTSDWSDRQLVASVPPGTPAEIEDFKVWAITSNDFLLWYKVKLEYRGREATGWVKRDSVEG